MQQGKRSVDESTAQFRIHANRKIKYVNTASVALRIGCTLKGSLELASCSSQKLFGVHRSCLELPGAVWISKKIAGIARDFGTHRSCLELPGIVWSSQELFGARMSCLELSRSVWNSQEVGNATPIG